MCGPITQITADHALKTVHGSDASKHIGVGHLYGLVAHFRHPEHRRTRRGMRFSDARISGSIAFGGQGLLELAQQEAHVVFRRERPHDADAKYFPC